MKKYIIYDNVRDEEVFEGTFEDYKNYVLSVWRETKKHLPEDYLKRQGLNEDLKVVAHLIEIEEDIFGFFNSLEYYNVNVFGDCTDLEIRNQNGEFLYKR